MPEYIFELQSLIKIQFRASDKEEARKYVVEKLQHGDYDHLFASETDVSDGKEV